MAETREQLEARLAASHKAAQQQRNHPMWIGGKAGEILASLDEGEPIFILRARDLLSTLTIRHYASLVEDYLFMGGNQLKNIVMMANEFAEWQRKNPGKVHLPD
jgi:hypothetical protein